MLLAYVIIYLPSYLNGDSGEEAALAEPWWEVDEIKHCVSTIECNDFRHAITYFGCYTNCYSTRAEDSTEGVDSQPSPTDYESWSADRVEKSVSEDD
ncbi:hypothetical protein GQ600_11130 [Phytophthora cactorum]|nr:hypothetical protein GQ600_11130 [Phytophthora cactorum]